MKVRSAIAADSAAIAAIWNPIIRDTTITFTPDERSEADIRRLIAERQDAGHAVFVADTGDVSGFGFYGQFRNGRGYGRTMEHTVHVAPAARKAGVGRALMAALEGHARAGGAHSLFAGVSGENPAGRAFHAALGFASVAVLPEVGHKFGRWIDLHLMRKPLG